MDVIGATACNSLDASASVAAVRCVVERCLDDELLYAVGRRNGDIWRRIGADRVCIDPVDLDAVARCSLTVDRYDRVTATEIGAVCNR